MDAYSGYNQIPMYGPDQEHTSFITDRGLYCYIGMPFGLLNAGATYQRLVNMMFEKQIGKTMEVYVDDMLVKSRRPHGSYWPPSRDVWHLEKIQDEAQPQKCVFRVEFWQVPRLHSQSQRDRGQPTEKIQALINMRSPQECEGGLEPHWEGICPQSVCIKIFRKVQEFFKAIKKVGKHFKWTPECEEAFHKIKEHFGRVLPSYPNLRRGRSSLFI